MNSSPGEAAKPLNHFARSKRQLLNRHVARASANSVIPVARIMLVEGWATQTAWGGLATEARWLPMRQGRHVEHVKVRSRCHTTTRALRRHRIFL